MIYADEALAHLRAGLCVVPPREDGSKAVALEWGGYQGERPPEEQIRDWYGRGRSGIVWVCGGVSGGLEVLDFELHQVYQDYLAAAEFAGLAGLLWTIRAGYEEETPSGGIHLPYRCAEISGSTKLARRPGPPDERGNPTIKVLIETRGEGGCVIVAPSSGRVHPTGRPYKLLQGSVHAIATISPAERRALHDVARTFDEMPKRPAYVPAAPLTTHEEGRPGDDYNARGNWRDLLERHGWTWAFRCGEVDYWRRPGKKEGISATTNHAGSGLLYVFSTSTIFESERGHSLFTAYALLEHGGDFAAAARALSSQGYGRSNRTVYDTPSDFSGKVLVGNSECRIVYDTPSDVSGEVRPLPKRRPPVTHRMAVEVGAP